MKTLIICKSIHQGNTKKIAEKIAEVLKAEIKQPEDVKDISGYDLIGFGSGIYIGKHHKSLFKILDELNIKGKNTFVFSTSGRGQKEDNKKLIDKLKEKGFNIVGNFVCKGLDKFGPLALIGGLNKGRPNEEDFKKAEIFAMDIINFK
jgi:flavodoxin